jgi:hypothetical protein
VGIDEKLTLLVEACLATSGSIAFRSGIEINAATDFLRLALGPFHDCLVYASFRCMYSASEGLVFN